MTMAIYELQVQVNEHEAKLEHLEKQMTLLLKFVKEYRRVYMDTQTIPTPRQELEVMAIARELSKQHGIPE